jgi:zinc protease
MVERELRALQRTPVPAGELEQARTLLIRRLSLLTESAEAIAARLLGLTVTGLPLDEPVRAAARYAALTPAEVQAAYARWIRVDDLVQVTLGP